VSHGPAFPPGAVTIVARPRRSPLPRLAPLAALALSAAALPPALRAQGPTTTVLATATVMRPAIPGFAVRLLSPPARRRVSATSVEIASAIEVTGTTPYRVLVRPDAAAPPTVRLSLRNARGHFEPLPPRGAAPVAVATSFAAAHPADSTASRRAEIVFRIDADDPATLDALTMPLAYEVVAQSDDAMRSYRFVAVVGR
jgi:hypothetical protein